MPIEKHLYIIPTNRDSRGSIASLINDINVALDEQKIERHQIDFVVLDSGTTQDFDLNHQQLLTSLSNSNLNAYHISTNKLDAMLRNVLEKNLANLVVGSDFSYGKMVNKISIIANTLNATYIHRRDSDVYLQKNNTQITPLVAELTAFKTDDQCIMAGSSYIGAWGIDYSDVENDITALRKLFSLSKPSYTKNQLDDYIHNKYIDGSKETFNGQLNLSESKANYIDAGNFALKNIFYAIPVSPADVTSGTDYLYHTVLEKSDWKMLYHNDRVFHQYTDDRYDRINHITYGDSKLLSRLMTTVTQHALKNVQLSNNFNEMSVQLAEAYTHAVNSNNIKTALNNTINKFITVYADIPYTNYQNVASHISQHKNYYIDKTLQDVNNFIWLINHWESILKKTQALPISDFLMAEL